MIHKIWNWIKNIFKPQRQEMDEHEELYLHVPEPDIPIYADVNGKAIKCGTHNRYKKSCSICREVAGIA
jgi:hypothetical protein|tara:strand:+ start:322 stop:528 length:207 start_codon:yes stop_codon:yes gene_type:complete